MKYLETKLQRNAKRIVSNNKIKVLNWFNTDAMNLNRFRLGEFNHLQNGAVDISPWLLFCNQTHEVAAYSLTKALISKVITIVIQFKLFWENIRSLRERSRNLSIIQGYILTQQTSDNMNRCIFLTHKISQRYGWRYYHTMAIHWISWKLWIACSRYI